jgi:hypothetical protein
MGWRDVCNMRALAKERKGLAEGKSDGQHTKAWPG